MTKIRFGILSTAKIGVEKVIPAMQKGRLTEVVAISSRSAERASAAAQRLGIARSYGSYAELLADPAVDAVYNPLPNDLHVPWSIKALEAGKHVLCEKPIALSAAQAHELVTAGRRHPRQKLMEAFMYRHHPQWKLAKQSVDTGKIGTLRTIQTFFSHYTDDPANIRHDPSMGGGCLMDVGCYAISLSRWLFEAQPKRVLGIVEYDPRFKVDRLASAILDFGHGTATFTCSTQVAPLQLVHIIGTEGRIDLCEVPFNAPNDRPCVVRYSRGTELHAINCEICDQYTIQGDSFAEAILNDSPVPTSIEDAVRNMEVIEAIVASGKTNSWTTPESQ
ncbi:MAG TPA: Gfo/Idh/MocA family oxidoreductase [Pirellulales bacterium]|nr:Gfo/Idh/MocA family oxidoreductase [Pirellulales bacterium]